MGVYDELCTGPSIRGGELTSKAEGCGGTAVSPAALLQTKPVLFMLGNSRFRVFSPGAPALYAPTQVLCLDALRQTFGGQQKTLSLQAWADCGVFISTRGCKFVQLFEKHCRIVQGSLSKPAAHISNSLGLRFHINHSTGKIFPRSHC